MRFPEIGLLMWLPCERSLQRTISFCSFVMSTLTLPSAEQKQKEGHRAGSALTPSRARIHFSSLPILLVPGFLSSCLRAVQTDDQEYLSECGLFPSSRLHRVLTLIPGESGAIWSSSELRPASDWARSWGPSTRSLYACDVSALRNQSCRKLHRSRRVRLPLALRPSQPQRRFQNIPQLSSDCKAATGSGTREKRVHKFTSIQGVGTV